MKKKTLIILISLTCFLLLAAVGAAIGIRKYRNRELEKELLLQEEQLDRDRESAFASLAEEEYSSVFFSMFSTPYLLEEYFQHYLGSPTLKQEYAFCTTEEINKALDIVFSSGNDVTNIYLGLDPFLLYHSMGDDAYELEAALESGLFSHADDHPGTSFEIILAFPSLNYWQSLSEGKFRISLILYRMLVDRLDTRDNIIVYFPCGQEWLLDNPANYVTDFVPEALVAQKLFLLMFCDGQLQINEDNKDEMLAEFSDFLLSRREAPVEYPDLSQWEITFFGDSVIGNYDGSLSIPGAVNGLSGAAVYNCAEGGASATGAPSGGSYCFPTMVEFFVNSDGSVIPDNNFGRGTRAYCLAKHTVKRRCFVINYGLNDYFCGYLLDNPENAYDTTTYAGAMRTGIATLKKRYPSALYVIMGPGQVTIFDNGTSLLGDSMEPLTTYSDCARALSEELGTLYIDLYNDLTNDEITLTDVLSDTVHYNEYGRYLVAIKIIDLLSRQPMSKQALQPAASMHQ